MMLKGIKENSFYVPKPGQKVIKELEENILSYSTFWPEWIKQEACTLTEEELYIIEVHSKNNFKLNLFESFMFYNQEQRIKSIVFKLSNDHQQFKDWVVTNFLFNLLKLIKGSEKNEFTLYAPIIYLPLQSELKSKLKLFNVRSIYEIFEKYKEADLKTAPLFSNIMAFEKVICSKKNNSEL